MADITHVEVRLQFGHEVDVELREKMKEFAKSIAESFGTKIPEGGIPEVPLICKHMEASGSGSVGDEVCLTVDASSHRRLAHIIVDALFDELEEDLRDSEIAKKIRQDEKEGEKEPDDVPEVFYDFFKEHFPSWFPGWFQDDKG